MINKSKNANDIKTIKDKKYILYAVGVATALLGIFYFAVELPMEQRFAVVYGEMEQVRSEVMAPKGAAEIARTATKTENEMPYFRGNNWISGCSVDVQCPEIRRTWQVTLEKGQETDFMRAAMKKMGYSIESENAASCETLSDIHSCSIMAKKDGFRAMLLLQKNTATKIQDAQRNLNAEFAINYR